MSDTQWPRYEVFHQEAPDRPHRHAGSVHAPDAEIALLNARNVFVRRPECSSLWVAPAAAILGGTAEELERTGPAAGGSVEGPAEYLVFAKLDARGTLTHIGEVHGASPQEAVEAARQACYPESPFVLWLVPAERVARTEPEEAAPLFAPAREKPYRDPAFYHIQTAMRLLRREGGG